MSNFKCKIFFSNFVTFSEYPNFNIQSKNQKTAHCGVRLSASSSQKLWGMNIKTYMPENRGIKAIPRSSAGRLDLEHVEIL